MFLRAFAILLTTSVTVWSVVPAVASVECHCHGEMMEHVSAAVSPGEDLNALAQHPAIKDQCCVVRGASPRQPADLAEAATSHAPVLALAPSPLGGPLLALSMRRVPMAVRHARPPPLQRNAPLLN